MADDYNATTTTEEGKQILTVPELPAIVQGDGRYLMSLLRSFLAESTKQINLANGFTAEELDDAEQGAVATPRNFRLTFDRLGGRFNWDHIADIGKLAYYELRTDTNIGASNGLLERTIENGSSVLPLNFVGHVYLYAFDTDGQYSRPAEILYNKPRPDAPQNIAITNAADGTLITFSEIPTNCIGAHIYINGKQHTALDNIFLLSEGVQGAEQIAVAFFDQFGDGEQGVLYLVLPDVTGFLVERNGPDLDFYWDALPVYNVKYVVKVCSELSWEKGTELFRTATNDKNRRLYPNRGDYYLMVKAYDDNGNYSKNAAYWLMTTETDISRNVILEFDQQDTLYGGTKINVYYNPVIEGVTLEREASKGEYIFNVQLDQEYKARNWLEYTAITLPDDFRLMWKDCKFTWASASDKSWQLGQQGWDDYTITWEEAGDLTWAGVLGNVDSAKVKHEIAYYIGGGISTLFAVQLNGDLLTDSEESPTTSNNADDFRQGRWGQGLYIGGTTELEYSTADITQEFSMVFYLKLTVGLLDTLFVVLADDNGKFLRLSYDARVGAFYLTGSDGKMIELPFRTGEVDYLTFGINQDKTARTLYVHSLNKNKTEYQSVSAVPIGTLDKLYCYPKLTL